MYFHVTNKQTVISSIVNLKKKLFVHRRLQRQSRNSHKKPTENPLNVQQGTPSKLSLFFHPSRLKLSHITRHQSSESYGKIKQYPCFKNLFTMSWNFALQGLNSWRVFCPFLVTSAILFFGHRIQSDFLIIQYWTRQAGFVRLEEILLRKYCGDIIRLLLWAGLTKIGGKD